MTQSRSGGYKKRIHQEPLTQAWAKALLEVPAVEHASPTDPPTTLAEQLREAQEGVVRAVKDARKVLKANPLRETVAVAAAHKAGRRGKADIVIADDGTVMLEVYYSGKPKTRVSTSPKRSDLPPLDEIREEAEALGIDTAPFGRSKTKLRKAIKKVQVAEPKATEPKDAEPKGDKPPGALSQIAAGAEDVNLSEMEGDEGGEGPDDVDIDGLLNNLDEDAPEP